MSETIKIAVDAMGGDGSPKKIVDGIIFNHKTNKNNFFLYFPLIIRFFILVLWVRVKDFQYL